MKSLILLLLHRFGYAGGDDSLCISALPSAPQLMLTGVFAVITASIVLRSFLDLVAPQSSTERLTNTRGKVTTAITASLVVMVLAIVEGMGGEYRADAAQWLQALGSPEHPMTVTGLLGLSAGGLVALRGMVLMQLAMFRRAERNSLHGVATGGALVRQSGYVLGDGNGMKLPGGGFFTIVLGVIVAAYGLELLRQVDLCL